MRGQGKVLPDHQRPEPGADESRQPPYTVEERQLGLSAERLRQACLGIVRHIDRAIGEPRYEQQSSKLVDARSQGNQQQQNGVRENRRYSNVSAAELRDHPAGYRQREHHPGRHGEKRTAEHPVGKLESVFYRGHPGAEAPETQSEHEEHAGDGNTFPYAAGGHSIDPGACLMDRKRGIRDVFRVLD